MKIIGVIDLVEHADLSMSALVIVKRWFSSSSEECIYHVAPERDVIWHEWSSRRVLVWRTKDGEKLPASTDDRIKLLLRENEIMSRLHEMVRAG